MNLLIHADPGARSGFVAAWLTNCLTRLEFDVGQSLRSKFVKIHQLPNPESIKNHQGIKIRIKPCLSTVDLLALLFLRKNVHVQFPNFTKDEYSLETFTKITEFSKEILAWDQELDYSLYDVVMSFAETFDTGYMINLYQRINNIEPSPEMIKMLEDTNVLNSIEINKNHACSILKLCLDKEQHLGLKEEHRFWSIVDVYNTTPVDELHDTVKRLISPENYGILL